MKAITQIVSVIFAIAMIGVMFVPVAANAGDYRNPNTYGYAVFRISAGSFADGSIYVSNDATPVTFDPAYNPDGTAIPGQNNQMLAVTVLPDGSSEPVEMNAGNYTAYLRQGNGDQSETQHFRIGGGATTYVPFLGAARPSDPRVVGLGTPIIITGAYGYAAQHTITVVDSPAVPATPGTPGYYTYSGDYAQHGGHYQYEHGVNALYAVEHASMSCHGDYKYVGNHFEYIVGTYHGTRYNVEFELGNPVYHAGTPGTPAIPAVTHEETIVDGTIVDVTAAVREAVAAGAGHRQIVFNNAQNPGGIFSPEGELLATIDDPAYGFVKEVHITYIGGWNPDPRTIDAEEYEVINLG